MSRSRLIVIAFVLAVLAAAWMLHHERLRTKAWLWHLRHDAVVMGNYVIPVPPNWCLENLENGDQLLTRLDTEDKSLTGKPESRARVSVHWSSKPFSEEDVENIASLDKARWEERGISPILWGMNVNGETITCVGGGEPGDRGGYGTERFLAHCLGSGGLDISISAPEADMKRTREIISGIRIKHSAAE
jgi:hypothetical protein